MKLVIGGAFQGKLEFVQKTYRISEGWIDGRECKLDEITQCSGINNFQDYIRRMLTTERESPCAFFEGTNSLTALEQQAEAFADWLYANNPNLIIVSNELGYGIVPMKKQDRIWRETVGRVCTCIAARADEVVRVVCGIGTWLKRDPTVDEISETSDS
ncbi:MAG: bifunctional adenosylcobinamide kinase/adenosylcobinamide-phosphate guanylyltransferase [Lachnospiraceae bacterium]|nr:bifunctional adenosylcobinamide kinase/adenosylcobinamide-phosphate guanylyltransferase [Lachnospiraceae bacterium]